MTRPASTPLTSTPLPAKDEEPGRHPYVRPKDAATLLILDRSDGAPKVLMGRRHMRHVFMPGKYVFPGGHLDPGDSRVPVTADYHPVISAKLAKDLKGPKTPARVRALGIAAIRETYEEAGLFVGAPRSDHRLGKGFEAFESRQIGLDLSCLRFIGRAITPPNRSRRFDTRFLCVEASAIADRLPEGTGPSGELEDLAWLPLEEASSMTSLPSITRQILIDLQQRMISDPELSPETPVPFYFYRAPRFERILL